MAARTVRDCVRVAQVICQRFVCSDATGMQRVRRRSARYSEHDEPVYRMEWSTRVSLPARAWTMRRSAGNVRSYVCDSRPEWP
jgi:hypothetical protein